VNRPKNDSAASAGIPGDGNSDVDVQHNSRHSDLVSSGRSAADDEYGAFDGARRAGDIRDGVGSDKRRRGARWAAAEPAYSGEIPDGGQGGSGGENGDERSSPASGGGTAGSLEAGRPGDALTGRCREREDSAAVAEGRCSSSASAHGEPVLLVRLVRRVFDRNGRCWKRVIQCFPVAPVQYDAHCADTVAAGATPSLRRACGDLRTGEQLLADTAADSRVTLARLRMSRRGRALLDQLAAEVRRRFAPRMRAAAEAVAGDAELAAWARMLQE
jgi:hypothetical protein